MATKRKKPPAPSLEQEAKAFLEGNRDVAGKVEPSSLRAQIAGQVLAAMLPSSSRVRAQELVEEAYRYADLILNNNK